MGNTYCKNNSNSDLFTILDSQQLQNIKTNYKIINVYWLDRIQVNSKIFADDYFKPTKKREIINNMLDYYLNHNDKLIYKKTDYLCNEKEKICICNIHAEDLRKIYDGINYKKNNKFISWYNCLLEIR
jgi:hypothetical protein